MADKSFQITLLISLITHTAIFLNCPHLVLLPEPKKSIKVKVVYLKSPPAISKPQKQLLPEDNIFLKIPSKIKNPQKPIIPPAPLNKKELLDLPKPLVYRESGSVKPIFIKTDIAARKKITLPLVEINKINNPSYISYYQIVREKIRRAAYRNYTHTETGEIYLTFLISNTGVLKDVRLIEERSAANFYLRGTALRSIKDASLFPPFPKELDYPQLSFNVIISFQIE